MPPSRLLFFGAAAAQEALDVGDELVTLGQARLVGKELEALDVGAGVVVGGSGRVEQVPALERPRRQLPDGRVDPEVLGPAR